MTEETQEGWPDIV